MRITALQVSGDGVPCRLEKPIPGFFTPEFTPREVSRAVLPSSASRHLAGWTGEVKLPALGPIAPLQAGTPRFTLLQGKMPKDWSEENDLEVVRGFLQGNGAARHELGRRLAVVAPKVRAHNASLPQPLEDATVKDITQQIQLTLIKRLPKYDGSSPLAHWAGGFVTHHFYKYFAANRRKQDVERDLTREYTASISDEHSEELSEQVRAALQQLPEEERQLLHMKIFRGWTFARIAEVTGRSEAALKSAFRRLLIRLRARLGPHWGFDHYES